MSDKKSMRGFAGKGYYIALILCAAAIGISGYLYYRNAKTPEPQANTPVQQDQDAQLSGQDIQVVAPPATDTPTAPVSVQDPAEEPQEAVLKTASPVAGQTISVYAMDCLSYNQTTRDWRTHNGIDIAAQAGTQVCAAADGTVYTVYEDETLGTTVVIRHAGGYVTRYSSLSENVSVAPGEEVKLGQPIGTVGASALLESAIGDHVHFSVTHNDLPMDPEDFFALG